jgi:hypothetical protein
MEIILLGTAKIGLGIFVAMALIGLFHYKLWNRKVY